MDYNILYPVCTKGKKTQRTCNTNRRDNKIKIILLQCLLLNCAIY